MDHIDRLLLAELQRDATQSYAVLGMSVGLSASAAHERVRKLRESCVIRRTAVEVNPAAVGGGVLSFVTVNSTSWLGRSSEAFAAIPDVLEAHVIAGSAALLMKVRTANAEQLQDVLRRIYGVAGVTGAQATVVLETFFERQISPLLVEEDPPRL